MKPSAEPPVPPLELAEYVGAVHEFSDPLRAYVEIGRQTREALLDLLPDDWSFEGKRALDFGSGAGRTLRHFMTEAESAEFWGADIHAPSIRWMQGALCPPLNAWHCAQAPPLGLEHESFDLIWANSVFTHLTHYSLAWLLELQRLLKPNGLLVATYMGRWNSEFLAGEPWDENRVGMNVLGHNLGWERGGPRVLMSDWWVRAHWGRAFEIIEIAPQIRNMSWALMRKREVKLTTEDLERPEDDPREYLALRHNLRQVHRELEHAQQSHGRELDAVRHWYERSLSWKLTSPLRSGKRIGRSVRSRARR